MFFIDLMLCTKDQNVSVPEMSKLILDRAHNSSWVVSIKALLIVHEIMNYGNEVSPRETEIDSFKKFELIKNI